MRVCEEQASKRVCVYVCVCVCVFGVQWRVMVLCMCSHHRETIVV